MQLHSTPKSNKSNKIILDLDDTIFGFTPAYTDTINRLYGTNITHAEAWHRDIYNVDQWIKQNYGIDTDCKDIIRTEPIYAEDQPVLPYMQRILREIQLLQTSRPVELHVVTHIVHEGSPFEKRKLQLIAGALKEYAPSVTAKYHALHISNPKVEFIKEFIGDQIDIIFDDALYNLDAFIQSDVHVNSFYIPLMAHNSLLPPEYYQYAQLRRTRINHCEIENEFSYTITDMEKRRAHLEDKSA